MLAFVELPIVQPAGSYRESFQRAITVAHWNSCHLLLLLQVGTVPEAFQRHNPGLRMGYIKHVYIIKQDLRFLYTIC